MVMVSSNNGVAKQARLRAFDSQAQWVQGGLERGQTCDVARLSGWGGTFVLFSHQQ
ncbi:hypothetical protein SNOG_14123 [Parastagonospora nodorum SN15]|uniref:Uncharacterized protein n=1 Tax=Phaeosphaeria nodorum (strain SN15 / ATCC MYA-4574 / FGSC 10173) TaxID=321614 RepID=Q0U1W1_PHANO|nr:hypothetical protein SNOG_14123 [Parastagonospora nodorum SN15]EAT78360.1 hypothetical protein SNOG_14123 [Parastagonospora nodorum SN15]